MGGGREMERGGQGEREGEREGALRAGVFFEARATPPSSSLSELLELYWTIVHTVNAVECPHLWARWSGEVPWDRVYRGTSLTRSRPPPWDQAYPLQGYRLCLVLQPSWYDTCPV